MIVRDRIDIVTLFFAISPVQDNPAFNRCHRSQVGRADY